MLQSETRNNLSGKCEPFFVYRCRDDLSVKALPGHPYLGKTRGAYPGAENQTVFVADQRQPVLLARGRLGSKLRQRLVCNRCIHRGILPECWGYVVRHSGSLVLRGLVIIEQ